jgi:CubicO group peptidase (beta-lactamase class C family)
MIPTTRIRLGFCLLFLCCAVTASYAQAWQARHGLTSAQYQAHFNNLVAQGYRLVQVSGYTVNNQERFASLAEKKPGPAWASHHGMTGAQYQTLFNYYVSRGYRLTLVNGYNVGSVDKYVAIWEQKPGPAWVAHHGMSSAQYQNLFNQYTSQGYRLTHVSGYGVNGQDYYAAIWEKKSGPAWVARHGMTSTQYQNEFNYWTSLGYRLVQVSGYGVNNLARYAAIWEQVQSPAWAARHGMSSNTYQGEFNNYFYQGYRLKCISGYTLFGQDRYAAIWESAGMQGNDLAFIDNKIQAYINQNNIPGLSLAITKNERLVFAKGYGYADQNAGEKVNPAHLFRVASISKPITAIAIMKLIEQGQLSLNQKVFGAGAVLGTQYGTQPYSERLKKITVKHLLEHTSGLSNDGGDPMFMNYNFNHSQLIGWVLDNRAVKNEPGTTYEYLNFGYCLLGRIIEAVTNQSYENYLKNSILAPSGVTRMQIGGDTLAARKPGEVVYYGPNGDPYGAYMKVTRMDAHGGWIATPIDLLRLMVRNDGLAAKPDILQPWTLATMFTPSSANGGYGKGWIVDNTYKGHNGAMPGTIGFLVSRNDGYSFAVLANTRPTGDGFCFGLKGVLDQIVTGVNQWPAYDLF